MHIIRPWLLVGKYRETVNLSLLQHYDIAAMLHLAERVEQPGISCMYLPVEDGVPLDPDHLQAGIEFIRAEQRHGARVLVACGAGVSRSVTFAIAALKEIEGLSLLEAWAAIKAVHPMALPHPELWQSLGRYYGEALPPLAPWLDDEMA